VHCVGCIPGTGPELFVSTNLDWMPNSQPRSEWDDECHEPFPRATRTASRPGLLGQHTVRSDYTSAMTRSQFLMAGAAVAIPGMAAEPTAAEKANLALVADFCAAFATRDMAKIASYLAPNCSYRITETAMPALGAAAVDRIKSHVERSSKIEFQILDSWARGPMVINERIDSFTRPDASPAYHLVGVFFIKDGKIAEWTDFGIRT